MNKNSYSIKNEDFPSLFCAADSASKSAQKRYLFLFRLDILFAIAGAILSSISLNSTNEKKWLFFSGGVAFLLSLIITIVIKSFSFEKTWYGGRAVAESVKTSTWRFMICAEPYILSMNSMNVDGLFHKNLDKIRDERKEILGNFVETDSSQPQITDTMKGIRGLSTEERKKIYVEERVANQREWYSVKAGISKTNEFRWFIAVMAMQLCAGVSAFALIIYPDFPLNLTSIFSTVAMGFLAWLQVRRHQEQSQSYNLAAQELASIKDNSIHIKTDDELSDFVANAENAISREHTLWIARRD